MPPVNDNTASVNVVKTIDDYIVVINTELKMCKFGIKIHFADSCVEITFDLDSQAKIPLKKKEEKRRAYFISVFCVI